MGGPWIWPLLGTMAPRSRRLGGQPSLARVPATRWSRSVQACRRTALLQHPTARRGYAGPAVAELKTEQILALLAPIVIIQLGLMIAALYDLEQEDRRVRGGSKLVWALVIVFVNIIGPIVYLVVGREEA
jgi:hypothetical protein